MLFICIKYSCPNAVKQVRMRTTPCAKKCAFYGGVGCDYFDISWRGVGREISRSPRESTDISMLISTTFCGIYNGKASSSAPAAQTSRYARTINNMQADHHIFDVLFAYERVIYSEHRGIMSWEYRRNFASWSWILAKLNMSFFAKRREHGI